MTHEAIEFETWNFLMWIFRKLDAHLYDLHIPRSWSDK